MRHIVAAGTMLALLAGVGCAKSDNASTAPSPSGSGSTAGAPVTLLGTVNDHGTKDLSGKTDVEVEQDDFYFNPTFIKAAPGSTIKVELKNEGTAPHTFTIDALHVDQTVDAGKDATVTVHLPASGATAFYCKFHHGRGMQGAFFFNAGDTVSAGGTGASTSSGDGGAYGK